MEVKIKDDFLISLVQGSSAGLADDAMNALHTSWNPMYLVCLLDNIYVSMLVEEQEFEHDGALGASMNLELADLHYSTKQGKWISYVRRIFNRA